MSNNLPQRMWINQPSTQQPLHSMHGQNVLAIYEEHTATMRIYPVQGDIVSLQVPCRVLSEGWRVIEAVDDLETDAIEYAVLKQKMVDCGWVEVHDEDITFIKHARLGMQQSSWAEAISACIEVASEA